MIEAEGAPSTGLGARLTYSGLDVSGAGSVGAARAQLERRRHDVVVLDLDGLGEACLDLMAELLEEDTAPSLVLLTQNDLNGPPSPRPGEPLGVVPRRACYWRAVDAVVEACGL